MTADRITAAIDQSCAGDYIEHAQALWESLAHFSGMEQRIVLYGHMLQPYKYFKDEWLARQRGQQDLADVMRPPAADKPLLADKVFDAVDSTVYRDLKREALKKAGDRLESTEFYGMLDLCKRRAKGKQVEPVHGKEKLVQNVIEAGLLGTAELESFLAGKVRQG